MPALWKDLPELLDDVGRELETVDPEYAEFLAGRRLMVVAAAQAALQQLVMSVEQRLAQGSAHHGPSSGPFGAPDEQARAMQRLFEEAGRDHCQRDRPLGTLLSAYQTGGHVAWRHIAATAVGLGLPAETVAALAEGVFRTVDSIGSATTTGYLQEQAESAGMREQWRATLADQLLTDGADPAVLEELAQRAGWPLPTRAAVVLIHTDDQVGMPTLARLAHTALPVHSLPGTALIVPETSAAGSRQRLSTLLRGCRAVVGPTVALSELADSARVTQDAGWALDQPDTASWPFFVEEHLDAIIVHRHPRLLNALRTRCLAPLQGASAGSRQPFQDTLRSWLLHMGDHRAVAADLQVHPQTVRYRMNRLHELFGPVLNDPEARLRLILALGWDRPGAPGQVRHRQARNLGQPEAVGPGPGKRGRRSVLPGTAPTRTAAARGRHGPAAELDAAVASTEGGSA